MSSEQTGILQSDHERPSRIRVETALSRFPIHCLSKKGGVTIDLKGLPGITDFKWEVTHNSKHGQAGPLAYKLDTLVVNRTLDQMGRPLPELIRIGSLSEVCRLLGTQDTGPNIANVKAAFLQNASTFINAKIRYRAKNGREKYTEIGYTRYSVIFTGEQLPDGRQADAVHIILNPPYRELLNHVELRPLDYDYLKRLTPGAQRFYELVSFQVYGAIAGHRARAKLLYSDYCKYAPQTRYPDFEHMKKQMFKVHVPHRESGYISKVDYQEVADEEGNTDWEMFYTPGPKAYVEYETFTNRQLPNTPPMAPSQLTKQTAGQGVPVQATLGLTPCDPTILAEMVSRGIAEAKARDLLNNLKPGQEVPDQLEYVDSLIAKDRRNKLENPPGLYVFYIRDNIVPPANFLSSRKMKLHEEAQQAKNSDRARQARLELDYEEYRSGEIARFVEALPPDEYKLMFDEQRREMRSLFRSMTAEQLDDVAHRALRGEVENKGLVPLLSFDAFVTRQLANA